MWCCYMMFLENVVSSSKKKQLQDLGIHHCKNLASVHTTLNGSFALGKSTCWAIWQSRISQIYSLYCIWPVSNSYFQLFFGAGLDIM